MEEGKFYVYAHFKRDTNKLFYVGKGNGYRYNSVCHRNKYWKNIVNKHGFYSKIIESQLTEQKSFESEIFYIKHFKMIGCELCNMTDGGEGASGTKRSEEFKLSITGVNNPNYKNRGINSKIYGRKHSLKSIEIMRMKSIKIPVVQYTKDGVFIKEWNSAKEADNELNINRNHICSCCKGRIKSIGGYKWEYKIK